MLYVMYSLRGLKTEHIGGH